MQHIVARALAFAKTFKQIFMQTVRPFHFRGNTDPTVGTEADAFVVLVYIVN